MKCVHLCAVNVVAMLHNFWEQRQTGQLNGSSSESDGSVAIQTESLLLYESAPSPGPPYVCYVTLPGGSCFGNYKVCVFIIICAVWHDSYTWYLIKHACTVSVRHQLSLM